MQETEDDWLKDYIGFLGEYAAEQKKKGKRKHELKNGERILAESGTSLYRFKKRFQLNDNEQLTFILHGEEIDAGVVSNEDLFITIRLPEDLGPRLDKIILQTDSSELSLMLKKRLEEVANKEYFFNRDLVDRLLNGDVPQTIDSVPVTVPTSDPLSAEQYQAVQSASGQDVLFLWGPPGTGKTKTLASIVLSHYKAGRRVLLVSNTNLAVDELLHRFCQLLDDDAGLKSGHILRIGAASDPKLLTEFGDTVIPKNVAARITAGLQHERQELNKQQEELRKELGHLALQLETIKQHRQLIEEINTLTVQRDEFWLKINASEAVYLQNCQYQHSRNEVIQKRSSSKLRVLLGSSTEKMKREAAENETKLKSHQEKLQGNRDKLGQTNRNLKALELRKEKITPQLPPETNAELENKQAVSSKKLQETADRITQIDRELKGAEFRLIKEARVLAANATKIAHSHKNFHNFDTVIIDEASMLLLPTCCFVAGLAKTSVVIGGDFRQLGPIVESKNGALRKNLGTDIFHQAGMHHAIRTGHKGITMLPTQHRMVPPIGQMIGQIFYDNLLKHGKPQGTPLLSAPFAHPIILIDTGPLLPRTEFRDGSAYTILHGLLIQELCSKWIAQGCRPSDIGIATPYRSQVAVMKDFFKTTTGVECGTAHTYQGKQKRVMIIDTVECSGTGLGFFLRETRQDEEGARLFNVLFSRSQDHLIVLADLQHLTNRLDKDSLLRQALDYIQEHGQVIPASDLLSVADLRHMVHTDEDMISASRDIVNITQEHYYEYLEADIRNAKDRLIIYSGYITLNRTSKLMASLIECARRGTAVTCIVPPIGELKQPHMIQSAEEALNMLNDSLIAVKHCPNNHKKLVYIDDRIVWNGSLNTLSHKDMNEVMTRIDSTVNARVIAKLFGLND